jgi:hypothetical protein
MESRMMAHISDDRWLAVGEGVEGLLTRIRAWFRTSPAEISLDDIIRHSNDHLLDDVGIRRTCIEDHAPMDGQRHRFWML